MTTTVLIIENDPGSGPGRLLDWIAQRDLAPVIVRAHAGEPLPATSDGHAALILLGGGMLPDADAASPWLPAERELLRTTVERDQVPVLGICLGAQLLAHTFGGEVRGQYGLPEKGVTELNVLPAAQDDPLLAGLPSTVRAVESHQDQITRLPADAVLLMSSQRCAHQMLRIGRSWGVQFHPEVSAARVTAWKPESLRAWGFDPAAVVAEADRRAAELEQTWSAVVGRFLDLARSGTPDLPGSGRTGRTVSGATVGP
ncbi:glutamine amidotransferase class-I [Kribbella flavida DSM 17836]|uniref:Glutamine amidotransferase class-I n=1 Tax=Kribbella flavida (strain DSM 17836 / JCM 10339 / NBRC 14399) TaxID=479435 RepID=D2Q1T8_KRIFD|nr:type 1 glutamine amidotransferase [Kribbella flavida]ADB32077.1 glutamine amidotransferase class-I [Kribbella flavida DSM 17836]